jgi:hypothetical protein
MRDGADGDDEAEIEEELEPRSSTLWFGDRARNRRWEWDGACHISPVRPVPESPRVKNVAIVEPGWA